MRKKPIRVAGRDEVPTRSHARNRYMPKRLPWRQWQRVRLGLASILRILKICELQQLTYSNNVIMIIQNFKRRPSC